jgi:DNA-binding CsgD family transcriptional regulator
VPDFRTGSVYSPRWPTNSPRNAPCPRRYTHRHGKLTPTEESILCAFAGTKSLRSLAADFGVSHETVRRIIREVEAAVA